MQKQTDFFCKKALEFDNAVKSFETKEDNTIGLSQINEKTSSNIDAHEMRMGYYLNESSNKYHKCHILNFNAKTNSYKIRDIRGQFSFVEKELFISKEEYEFIKSN